MKNIVRLAKRFDQFIELESSFVLVEDIKAIRVHKEPGVGGEGKTKGMEIVTPYGTFYDSTDFNTFKTRIADTIEALKEREAAPVVEKKIVPVPQGPESDAPYSRIHQGNTPDIQVFPTTSERVTVGLTGNGSTGKLFDDLDFKVVNREEIVIFGPDGVEVAKGTSGGTIIGAMISGIVYESGKYTLSAKNYPANSVTVLYNIQRRR